MARKPEHHKKAAMHMEKAEMYSDKAAKHNGMAKACIEKMKVMKPEKDMGLMEQTKSERSKEAAAGHKYNESKKHKEAESKGMKKEHKEVKKEKKSEKKDDLKSLRKSKHTKF